MASLISPTPRGVPSAPDSSTSPGVPTPPDSSTPPGVPIPPDSSTSPGIPTLPGFPALIGDPLLAWREDATLQIGCGTHSVLVNSAAADLPAWVRGLRGDAPLDQVVARAQRFGVTPEDALQLLQQLHDAGLVGPRRTLRVHVAARSLAGEALREALTAAGVELVRGADTVVFPLGQLPSLVAAPTARRLIPVWFAAGAVHVGPVIDDARGPCPQCVDLHYCEADPLWPRLVAQAGSVGSWSQPAQMVQAAGLIALLAAGDAVGLEMIMDPAHPGPRWRVWQPHPQCPCRT